MRHWCPRARWAEVPGGKYVRRRPDQQAQLGRRKGDNDAQTQERRARLAGLAGVRVGGREHFCRCVGEKET